MSFFNQKNGWLSKDEIKELGFSSVGENVLISNKCSIYGAENISLGSNIRIDDYCVLTSSSGEMILEGYNHISSFCYLNASGKIIMKMFSGLSSRCSLHSSSDNYDGTCLTNPTVPKKFLNVKKSPIVLGRHVIIGNNSSILPGCTIGIGSAVGAFSLVNKDIQEFKIAVGIPAKVVKDRDKGLLKLEEECLKK